MSDKVDNLQREVLSLQKQIERLGGGGKNPRVERCCECGSGVTDWVEAEHRNGRICRPCEHNIALKSQLVAAEANGEVLRVALAAYQKCEEMFGHGTDANHGDDCADCIRFKAGWKALSTPPSTFLREYLEPVREALEKLSKLGNEPLPGNSTGNVIAQEALQLLSTLTPRNE